MNQPSAAASCELCGDPIALDGDRQIRLRHADPGDGPALEQLYQTLSVEDLVKRFFTSGCPELAFFDRWAALEETGGLCLVAEITDPQSDEEVIVAEAGYSPLRDGDVELGIAVRPEHRGWTGGWILDALFQHAHARGIENIQATIKTNNRAMMQLAAGHGCAVLGHPDWGIVHLTMSTAGDIPSWPPKSAGTRVLIESDRSRWPAEDELRQAGATVAICNRSAHPEHECPLISGHHCPLVDGADVIVIDLPEDHPRRIALTEAEHDQLPEAVIASPYRPSSRGLDSRHLTREIVDRVTDLLEQLGQEHDDGAAE